MKTKRILLAVIAVLMVSGIVFAQTNKSSIKDVVFSVNMDCNNCKKKIEKNIAFEKGVKSLDVNLQKKTVAISYDTKKNNYRKFTIRFPKNRI
jgi:copper chaperone CopZ